MSSAVVEERPVTSREPLDGLITIVADCEATNDFSRVKAFCHEVFSDEHGLIMTFSSNHILDRSLVQEIFHVLLQCPIDVSESLVDALSHLLQNVPGRHKWNHLSLLIAELIYHFLLEANLENCMALTANFLQQLVSQSSSMQRQFCSILGFPDIDSTTVSPDVHAFRASVRFTQQFITACVQRRPEPLINSGTDADLRCAIRWLGIQNQYNEKHRFVPYIDFYNTLLNGRLDIKDDYAWFSCCDYPFILDASTKANILRAESMLLMRHELQDAFFRALFEGVTSPYLFLEIRRDHILQDAIYQLSFKSVQDLRRQLRVQFVGEEGVDEGGVQKEFFQLVVREMFHEQYGIFQVNQESQLVWFTLGTSTDQLAREECKLLGMLMGLAIYNGVIVDVHFPLALYKKLMGIAPDMSDLQQWDPTLARGFHDLLIYEGDVQEVYDRTFQTEVEVHGERIAYDLCPDGANLRLTQENRHGEHGAFCVLPKLNQTDFVRLYIDLIFNTLVKEPFEAFQEGFDGVLRDSCMHLFRPEELETLICGSPHLDFDALQKATLYDGGYSPDSRIIRDFWSIVHEFTEAEKKQLLFFCTGSDRVPIGGLSKLHFVIAKNGHDSDRLPTSHTCYNVLLLCEYSSKEKLRGHLLTAIGNAEGFGMI